MAKVNLLVTVPRCVWLPGRPGKTGRTMIEKPVLLKPGGNRIDAAYWSRIKDHPGVVAFLKRKEIKLVSESVAKANILAPDLETGLQDLTVEKARPFIAECANVETLEKWKELDNRKTVQVLIEQRIEEIEGPELEDEDEDEDETVDEQSDEEQDEADEIDDDVEG